MAVEKHEKPLEHSNFVLSNRDTAPEIYADGFTHMLVGYPMTKLVLHSLVDPLDGGKEQRSAVATITMSTVSLLEMAHAILSACKRSEEELITMVRPDDTAQKIRRLLEHARPADTNVEVK